MARFKRIAAAVFTNKGDKLPNPVHGSELTNLTTVQACTESTVYLSLIMTAMIKVIIDWQNLRKSRRGEYIFGSGCGRCPQFWRRAGWCVGTGSWGKNILTRDQNGRDHY